MEWREKRIKREQDPGLPLVVEPVFIVVLYITVFSKKDNAFNVNASINGNELNWIKKRI